MGKKLYITTAIPYANSKPHIGNALDYLLADIWARYHRQLGKEVDFRLVLMSMVIRSLLRLRLRV